MATTQNALASKSVSKWPVSARPRAAARSPSWPWAVLCGLGLLVSLVTSDRSQSSRLSVARTATVVAEAQAGLQGLVSALEATERGEPGGLAGVTKSRQGLQVALALLQRGGYAQPGDASPVMALSGRSDVPLPSVAKALEAFDQASQGTLAQAAALERAGAADRALPLALQGVSDAATAMAQQPALNAEPWASALSPLRTEFVRPELKTMPIVFSPLAGASGLQGQWSDRFGKQAVEAQRLEQIAGRDGRLPLAAKNAVVRLSQQAQALAQASQALAQTNPARLEAAASRAAIRAPLATAQKSLDATALTVLAMGAGRSMGQFVAWGAGLLALVGLGGFVLAHQRLLGQARHAGEESRAALAGAEHIDRITRQMRKVVPAEGAIVLDQRLAEDAESPLSSLIGMINRVLDTWDRSRGQINRMADGVEQTLIGGWASGANLTTHAQRSRQAAASTETVAMTLARQAADLASRLALVTESVRTAVANAHRTEATVQEGGFRMDALRENTQDTSKRLKRLGESTQAIAYAIDVIHDISQKVQVLSMNAAIEAANAGDAGRNFGVIALEIQRLAQNSASSTEEINRAVEIIQDDAQKTVAAMEQSTAEVVETAKLSGRVGVSLRELERSVLGVQNDLQRLIKDTEQQAVQGFECSEGAKALAESLDVTHGEAQKTQELLDKARASAVALNRHLGSDATRVPWSTP